METPYDGSLDFSDRQLDFLVALLAGPFKTLQFVGRGAVREAGRLREINLVEWIPRRGWRLTRDGAELAQRIAACAGRAASATPNPVQLAAAGGAGDFP